MSPDVATALAGLRVLEIADAGAAYCGKLLADLGADVVKVEPPGGDPSRHFAPFVDGAPGEVASLHFLYMNTNKRSVVLDLASPRDRTRAFELATLADLVIETRPPGELEACGLGWSALAAVNPALVLTSITGFGQTGPWRELAASDLVAGALGGGMTVTGDGADPPLALAGEQNRLVAATNAAAASLIALHHAGRTGAGQHVDISLLESATAVAHICGVGKWRDDGIVPRRYATGLFASVPSGAYRCRDGLVYLMVNRPLHWEALAKWIHEETGNEEVLDPMFRGPSSNRIEYRELLDLFIAELTERHDVEDLYREGQRRHIAMTPVNTASAVIRARHLAARNFFVEVPRDDGRRLRYPGAPYRHARTPWRIERSAPRIGEHEAAVLRDWQRVRPGSAAPQTGAVSDNSNEGRVSGSSAHSVQARTDRDGALADLRVIEFTAGMAGPWIGRFMAWCGADVIKVESQARPSVVRLYVPPRAPERGTQPESSPWFTDWDAGKRFVALDLTRPEAVELAKRLVETADVVIENYSAGVMAKLGLGHEVLRERNPDLVYFGTSGYGDTGPDASFVTWGPNIEALAGMSTLSGFPERACTTTQYAYPDGLSALHGLVAVMAAVRHREHGGAGQAINLSQFETCVAALGPAMMEALESGSDPDKLGNASRYRAPQGCFPCAGEDRWCVLGVEDDDEWRVFCAAIGRDDWAGDARFRDLAGRLSHAPELAAGIAAWTSRRSREDVMRELQAVGLAAAAVHDVEDQWQRDPQLAFRGFFEEVPHLKLGRVVATGIPLGLTGTPGRTTRSGAAIGEDNEVVLRELLGMSEHDYRAAIAAGAIEAPARGGADQSPADPGADS